jgi:hypothetical protein
MEELGRGEVVGVKNKDVRAGWSADNDAKPASAKQRAFHFGFLAVARLSHISATQNHVGMVLSYLSAFL